ncbi:unnamed protein product [Schistosoma curassoni]|uniref:Uncharacterized protein n=1 Tax=Schistosoma curassoni TaxID=6186 RepID=A0A183JIX6_9TREM|nr:unnamed protein product [Schistosoma curassoni]
MSELKLDCHEKSERTGWLFRPNVKLLSSAHPRSRAPLDSNSELIDLACERLAPRPLLCLLRSTLKKIVLISISS